MFAGSKFSPCAGLWLWVFRTGTKYYGEICRISRGTSINHPRGCAFKGAMAMIRCYLFEGRYYFEVGIQVTTSNLINDDPRASRDVSTNGIEKRSAIYNLSQFQMDDTVLIIISNETCSDTVPQILLFLESIDFYEVIYSKCHLFGRGYDTLAAINEVYRQLPWAYLIKTRPILPALFLLKDKS